MLFSLAIAILLWVFQITLLNSFYKTIKYNEIKNTALDIAEHLYDENAPEFLQAITKNDGIDMMITDDEGTLLASMTSVYSVFFNNLTADVCVGIYEQTQSSGGEYLQWVESTSERDTYEEIIYVMTTSGDDPLLIILNARVTPVDSTVTTLKIQLWCVTAVMLILSLILAFTLSRRIAKPLININEGAKEIAKSNYNVQFIPHGSKEIRELSNTLNYATQELSKVEELRRELLANVSHDLRTPLTMISGYAEVMRDIPGENSPENLQVIIDEAERLNNLVSDLLELSKLEAGKIEYKIKKVNITKSIEEILTRYDKLIDFNFSFYHGKDVYVMGDELKISQVIYNLVNNAINYTGEDKAVTLTQIIDGNNVKIEITDSGEGIPQDKIKDIWDRYYKVDKSHKSAIVGTGIGLSIVKKVLDVHSGTYGVVSTLGKGSTFWFTLPLIEEEEII